MKKILLSLFLIATSMETVQLSAYCFYNHSKDQTITILIFPKTSFLQVLTDKHVLSPGDKGCWNWKKIDKNRETEWRWKAKKGSSKFGDLLGEGYFPIGGTIHFEGEVGGTVFKGFNIYYDGKPWKYWESPWNWPRGETPWKTYKR